MKQNIPESLIEEIRTRADIVQIISEVVLLKKSGKNYKGLCPFHSEKTPSFSVSPEKQIYHCFGCGAGGNVFKFVMETQSLPFLEAVRKLAVLTNVAIPSFESKNEADGSYREKEVLLNLNSLAAEYFRNSLKHPQIGLEARKYLDSRQISEKTLESYQIGWAPNGWNGLMTSLKSVAKEGPIELEKAGLVIRKDSPEPKSGHYYDRFRGRIMFPLKDIYGKIVGFAGRIIQEGHPKYLNSPETLLYKKAHNLFGLDRAKDEIRKKNEVIIVEGYFDQIRAWQNGILNCVASCGTALTSQQVRLLKNYSSHAILVFDPDEAGQRAAERGFEVFLEQGIHMHLVILPGNEDPDSYILNHGAEAFLDQVKSAKPFMEFFIQKALREEDTVSPAGRMKIINRVLPVLSKIRNDLERSEWIKFLSERGKVEDKALLAELRKAMVQKQGTLAVTAEKTAQKQNPEFYLVHLMLTDNKLAREIHDKVKVDEFKNPAIREAVHLIYDIIEAGESVVLDRLVDKMVNPDAKSLLTGIGLEPISFDDHFRGAEDCILELKKRNLQEKIRELKRLRNEAQKAGQSERSREIHNELMKMQYSHISG